LAITTCLFILPPYYDRPQGDLKKRKMERKMRFKAFSFVVLSLFFSIRLLSAQTWEATKRITWINGFSTHPSIALDSNGDIHLVWDDDNPGNSEIYSTKSTDGGATWSKPKRITWNTGSSAFPDVAIDSNNNMHLVWHDNSKDSNLELLYKKSTDGGATWSKYKRFTWNTGRSLEPTILIDSYDHIHVVWQDESPGNFEIFYKRSTDGGLTWFMSDRLTWTATWNDEPAMAADSNDHIHLVWRDDRELYCKRSTDRGATWLKYRRLTWNSGLSCRAAIGVDTNDHIHVIWQDDSKDSNFELLYKKSTDNGATWSKYKRLTRNAGASIIPAIALDAQNHIHLVWQDDSMGIKEEVYYKRSTDGGSTWTTKRLTWNSGQSSYPEITIDSSSNIHIVWNDSASGNFEIYYKKGIQ
jgi:hypothetical protein